MYEALRDPKTWLFALFSAAAEVPVPVVNQRQIIVASFGFSSIIPDITAVFTINLLP